MFASSAGCSSAFYEQQQQLHGPGCVYADPQEPAFAAQAAAVRALLLSELPPASMQLPPAHTLTLDLSQPYLTPEAAQGSIMQALLRGSQAPRFPPPLPTFKPAVPSSKASKSKSE